MGAFPRRRSGNALYAGRQFRRAGRYSAPSTGQGAPELNRVFMNGVHAINEGIPHPLEKGCAFFLFGALQQFFFDGNKRPARLMMNGILMSAGIDAIGIQAAQAETFNHQMARFYFTKEATEMMAFLTRCHPAAENMDRSKQDASHDYPTSSRQRVGITV